MKLRLPSKLQAALIATLASAALTTLSTGSTAQAWTLDDAALKMYDFTQASVDGASAAGWTFTNTVADEDGVFSTTLTTTNTAITHPDNWAGLIGSNRVPWAGVITINVNDLSNANGVILNCSTPDGSGTGMGVGYTKSGSAITYTGFNGTSRWGDAKNIDITNLEQYADANGLVTVGVFYTGTGGMNKYVEDQFKTSEGLRGTSTTQNPAMRLSNVAGVAYTNLYVFAPATNTAISQADMQGLMKAAGAYYWNGSAGATWSATSTNWTHYGSNVGMSIGAGNAHTNVVFGADGVKDVAVAESITVGDMDVEGAGYAFTVADGAKLTVKGNAGIASTIALNGGTLSLTDATVTGPFTSYAAYDDGQGSYYSKGTSGFLTKDYLGYLVKGGEGAQGASISGSVTGAEKTDLGSTGDIVVRFAKGSDTIYYVNEIMDYASDMDTATDFVIKKGAMLDVGSDGGTLTGTLRGKGTFAFTSALNNVGSTQQLPGALVLDGAGWQGIVQVNGGVMNVGESIQHLTTGDSWVELRGVSGRLGSPTKDANTTYSGNVILTNADAGTPALSITNSGSGSPGTTHITTLTGNISGTGDIERKIGNGNNLTFAGDISGWTGTYYNGNQAGTSNSGWNVVTFTQGGEINANFVNKAYTGGCYLTLNFNGDNTIVNGTLSTAAGAGKTTQALNVNVNGNTTFNKSVGATSFSVASGKTATLNYDNTWTNTAVSGAGTLEIAAGRTLTDIVTGNVSLGNLRLNDEATLKVRGDSGSRTFTITSLAVSGTAHVSNMESATGGQGWNSTINITALTNAGEEGAVITLGNAARADATAINLNGGAFKGEIVLRGEATTNGPRRTAYNFKAADVAKDSVVTFDALQNQASHNKLGMGVGTDITVQGIRHASGNAVNATIFAGTVNAGHKVDFDSQGSTPYTITIAGSGEYTTSAIVKSLLNITMDGTGTQTFSGNVSAFNGALTVNSGTLAFTGTGGISTTSLTGTGGTLDVTGTLAVANAEGNEFSGTLAVGGLTKTGDGTLTLHGFARLGGTIQVNEGSLVVSGGTYNLTGLTIEKTGAVIPPTATENGYGSYNGAVQFITGTGTYGKQGDLVFKHGELTAQADAFDTTTGQVTFAGFETDYTRYYVNQGTVNYSDEFAAVTDFNIAAGATLAAANGNAYTTAKKLHGAGTYALAASQQALNDSLTLGSDWTGVVRISGTQPTNGWNLATLDAIASTIEFAGVKNYFSNPGDSLDNPSKLTRDVIFTNPDANSAAVYFNSGYSRDGGYEFSGSVSGSGTFHMDGGSTYHLTFSGNVSDWDGLIKVTNAGSGNDGSWVRFSGNAHEVNAAIEKTGGTFRVIANTDATFNKSIVADALEITAGNTATVKNSLTTQLKGAGKLVVDNSGYTATVNGTPSGYTGDVTVNSGTLQVVNAFSGGNITVASGAGITFGNGASLAANSLSLEAGAKLDFSAYTGSIGSKVNVVTTTDGVTGYDGATITGPTAPRGMQASVEHKDNDIVLTFQAKSDATMHLYILTGQSNSLGAVKDSPLNATMLAAYQSEGLLFNGNMNKDSGVRFETDPTWQIVAPQKPDGSGYNNNPCMGPEYGFSYIMENKDWGAQLLGEDGTLAVVKGSLDGGGNGCWLQNANAYQSLLGSVKESIQDAVALGYSNISLDGLMYLQGESNSAIEASQAATRFTNFIGYLKSDLQSWLTENPELTGITLSFDGNTVTGEPRLGSDARQTTETQLLELATSNDMINADKNGKGHVLTNDLAVTNCDGLNVHYTGNSQLTIGARYAYAFAVQKGIDVGAVRGQDDSKTLDQAGAWWMEKLPGENEVATWDISSVSTVNEIAAGKTLTVGGIKIDEVYSAAATAQGQGSVAINGGTISLGQHGITLVGGDLAITSAVSARESQTWQAAAGHKLAVNATTTISDGATLTLADNLYLTFGAITGAGNLAIGHVTFDMDMDYMLANGLGKYRSTETPDGENGYFTGNLDLVHLTGENSSISFTGEGGSMANITKAGELANYTLALTNEGKTLSITGLPLETETYYARRGEVVYTSADDDEFGIYGASKVMLAGSVEAPATLKLVSGLKAGTVIDTSGLGGTVSFDSGMELAESSLGTLSSGLTLTGTGTFVMNAKSGNVTWPLPTNVSLAQGENGWKGIVRISGGNFKANDLDALANGLYSTIELNGVSGWTSHSNGTLALNLMLTDKEDGTAAWDFNAGASTGDYDNPKMTITGKVSGTGTLKKTNANHESFAFSGDISEWTGKYMLTVGNMSRLTFLGDAHEVNIDTEKTNANGKLSIAVGDGTAAFSTRFTEQSNMQGVNEILVRANASAEFAGTISASEVSTFNGNVTNSGTMTLNGLTMAANTTFTNTGTFTLGGAISINNSASIANNGSMVVTGDSEQTLGGTLSGSGSLTKDGTGTLTVSGNNTGYTGNISVVGGTLKVGNNNALGNLSGARTLIIQTGGTLDVNGKEGNAAKDFVVELAGGTLANSAAGSLSYGTRHFVTSVNVTDDSTIQADSMFGLTAGSYNPINVVFTDGTTLEKKGTADFVVTKATITGNGTFKVSAGTLKFQYATTSSANFIMNGGSVAVGQQGAADYTLSRDIAITTTANSSFSLPLNTNAHAITYNGNANLAVSGAISGTGSLVKDGAGTLTLSDASTYTGGTTISAGTVATSNTNALGLSGVTIADGATLQVSGELNIGGTGANSYGVLNNGAGGTIALTDGSFLKLHAGSGSRTYNLGKVNVNGSASISEEWFDATVNIANINGGATDELALISNHSNARGIWNIGTATGQAQNYTGTLILNDQDTNGNNSRAVNFNFKDGSMFKSASIKLRDGEYSTDRTGNPMENNIILAASEVSFGSVSDLPAQGEHTRPSVWTVKSDSDTETRTLVLDAKSGSYTTQAGIAANVNIKKTGASEQTFTGSTANFNGSIDVEAGVLNIMNAASVSPADVTIGAGATMGVYKNGTATEANEGKVTIASSYTLSAGNLAKLNSDLEMAHGSRLDVSQAQVGSTESDLRGLIMGSSVTIQGASYVNGQLVAGTGVSLVYTDDLGVQHDAMEEVDGYLRDYFATPGNQYYVLFDSVEELYLNGATTPSGEIAFNGWDKPFTDANTLFNNVNQNTYAVVYSFNGSNVGTLAICLVPEPTTSTLSLLALCALAARRRRK